MLKSKPFESDPLLWKIVDGAVIEDDLLIATDLETKEEALEQECFTYWYSLMAPTTFSLYGEYKAISSIIRKNMTHLFVYRIRNNSDLEGILEELSGIYDKKILLQIYHEAIDEEYSFLYINLMQKDK